jgi:hypothetical protein
VFDIVEKSSKFLLEIITLVSAANKKDSDKVFSVGGRLLIFLAKEKALKLTPGELHVLLFNILRNIFQIILFQLFLFVTDDLNQLATIP